MCENDILQPVTKDEDLIRLRNIFKDKKPHAAHVYNYLSYVIRRRTLEPNSTHFTIFAPNGNFDTGTFIGVESGAMFMYTLEEDCKMLQEILHKTNRFDWKLPWVLYCIIEQHYLIVMDILTKKEGFHSASQGDTGIWWLPKDKALNFTISCPEEVYISQLKEEHVDRINSVWSARSPGSEAYLYDIIQIGGGYGVFLKANNLLVSWALNNPIGIGNIQTESEYKQKGYGSLIGKYISKIIAEKGCDPLGTVRINNIASETMFSKLGFELIGTAWYSFGQTRLHLKD